MLKKHVVYPANKNALQNPQRFVFCLDFEKRLQKTFDFQKQFPIIHSHGQVDDLDLQILSDHGNEAERRHLHMLPEKCRRNRIAASLLSDIFLSHLSGLLKKTQSLPVLFLQIQNLHNYHDHFPFSAVLLFSFLINRKPYFLLLGNASHFSFADFSPFHYRIDNFDDIKQSALVHEMQKA